MSTLISGFGPQAAEGTLQPQTYELDALAPGDVLVAVTHCGVCFSDVDCIDDAFGRQRFPFIPGHEVVGTVAALGAEVRGLDIGQRVGVGPNVRSCLHCDPCRDGAEQLCTTGQMALSPGLNAGFADHAVAGAEWVFPIPDAIASAEAAPLMYAGITTFSPLRRHVTPMMRVGIVGIGGLGHLALQFASKLGPHVTAIAANTEPEDAALFRRLGASDVLNLTDPAAMRAAARSFDFILSTVYGADTSVTQFMRLLRHNGKLCVVGAAMRPLDLSVSQLVFGQTSVVGRVSGSRHDARDMLAFALRHGVRPMVETVAMHDVNDAIDRIRKGSPRFRMVLTR